MEAVPVAQRDLQPGAGWSVAQVLEHLAVTEAAITGVLRGFVADAQEREGAEAFDAGAFASAIDMPFFLDRSNRIQGRQPPGELNAARAWSALEESRRGLLETLASARGKALEDVGRDHPATRTPLDGYQWIAFLALHEGRHAAQVAEIGATLQG